jgi:predicted nucleotide-binding protein (sugar kinase/HSP70/actin superfamily)
VAQTPTTGGSASVHVSTAARVEEERRRLLREAGLDAAPAHYRRLPERPFTAEERDRTTILFGNLTPKHEAFIQAVFQGCGYRCESLPTPSKSAFQVGKEYCNNGLCNPNYFTAGNLIEYLRGIERQGLSREEIVDRYVYFTAGGCGPCRFGTYESEYRQALHHAGFPGFRILTFQSTRVFREGSREPGLRYTMDFGLGMLNALVLGDVLYDLAYQIRPYEVRAGETDRVFSECVAGLAEFLKTREPFDILRRLPRPLAARLEKKTKLKKFLDNLGKYRRQLYGADFRCALERSARRLDAIEVDRTRPLPIIKITGEFFSQLAEGDANYSMFAFLEQEGGEVAVEPISALVLYWLDQAERKHACRKGLDVPHPAARPWHLRRRLANELSWRKKQLLLRVAARLYARHYRRVAAALGGLAHPLAPQAELARLARPFYDPLTRGGEGHLEIAKSIYYTRHRRAHAVLSLKPFGCMPSTQSDGAMAAVTSRHPELLFLSVETSGEGEINARSRVQMLLGEARRRARGESEEALGSTGRSLAEIRGYIAAHPELRRPFYRVPRRLGVVSVAANFLLHVGRRMNRRRFPKLKTKEGPAPC